jgi:long-chain fatty acid transport protein
MKKTILGCAAAVALCQATAASAGGLWLNTVGDSSGGRAGAGAAAGTDDAATVLHNPASATRIKGKQLFASAGGIIGDIKFKPEYSNERLGYGNGGDAGGPAPLGSGAYVQNFGDSKWSGGIYFAGLAGAGLDYDKDWVGRYQATKVELLVAAVAPTLAYQLTDKLSFGASLQYWYANLDLKLQVPRLRPGLEEPTASINGDDTGFAYTLGVMYELTDRTRFGIHYQSKLDPKFDGDLKVKGPGANEVQVGSNTQLNMAQYARASMHHDMDEQWAVNFTIGWDDWSQLGDVLLSTDNREASVPTKWKDTYHYAWGVEYQLNKQWALTSGVSYDTNPVSAQNRNAQLPVDRQISYAFGAGYTLNEAFTVGGYVNYIDLGRARISNPRFGGEYKNNSAVQIMVNANWTF